MKTQKNTGKHEGLAAVASSVWLDLKRSSFMHIQGYTMKCKNDGSFVKYPISLSDQFRNVKSILGAKVRKQPFRLEFEPVVVDGTPNRRNLGFACRIMLDVGADKSAAMSVG
jgi:hypothetical protein